MSIQTSHLDLEQGILCPSDSGTEEASSFPDSEDVHSCNSQFYSTSEGSNNDYTFSSRECSDCSVVVEMVESELSDGDERDCRICQMGLDSNEHESGIAIELGCSCKDDLGSVHKQCAETWFKIKGDKICEICHSVARNIVGPNEMDQIIVRPNDSNNTSTVAAAASATAPHSETPSFWQGRRFLNLIIACMVFAFVISWLFHFNISSL